MNKAKDKEKDIAELKPCLNGERLIETDDAIEIVNQVAEEYGEEVCEWKFEKSVVDSGYIFSSGCNHKRFSDLHSFVHCPYCGKKIKVVKPYKAE